MTSYLVLQPITATLLAFVFLGETLGWVQDAGMVAIAIGLGLVIYARSKELDLEKQSTALVVESSDERTAAEALLPQCSGDASDVVDIEMQPIGTLEQPPAPSTLHVPIVLEDNATAAAVDVIIGHVDTILECVSRDTTHSIDAVSASSSMSHEHAETASELYSDSTTATIQVC
jgi:hypothetical protein